MQFEEVAVEELKNYMQKWFVELIKLTWLGLLADKGDDTLTAWREENFLSDCHSHESLLETFSENESIFAMLLGVRFKSQDKKFTQRVEVRAENQLRLVDNAVLNLFGEESLNFSENVSRDDKLEEATFIVRRVAMALNMQTENIRIAPELIRKLDQVRLLRRLIQKGNMQMRFITLVKDWYKFDSGVLIGYYGEKKELAVFVPTAPGEYTLVTKNLPDGIKIGDAVAGEIAKDAFECYGGFPSRELKILDLMKFIFKQCWVADYKTVIAVGLFSGLIPLVMPIVTETIFADIIPILDREGLATVTQVTMVTSFTMASLGIVRTIAVMRITTRINFATAAALWNRLLTLPTKFFRQYTTGELASRMGGIDVIKGLVSPEFISGIFGFVFSFWSIFLMCYYSLKLSAVAMVVWLVYSIITAFIYRRVIGFQRNLIAAQNEESGTIQQIFSGFAKFKEHGAEKNAYYLWSKVFGETWKWNLKLRWQGNYNTIIGSMQPFILTMALYYIAVYGMEEVVNGQTVQGIGYAQFIAFQSAFTAFNGTLNGIIPLVGQYFAIQPHIENFRPILQEIPESVGDKPDAGILSGAIEVNNLSFSYVEGREVLHDINFKISAGENVAIVGKSGCGKSTLVRLLLGFETPKSGAIYFDGQDLSELNMPSVRTQLGVVLQNGQLMSGDIFTNIIGTNSLTQEDAWEAAKAAGIADDIAMMPMGMQTVQAEQSADTTMAQYGMGLASSDRDAMNRAYQYNAKEYQQTVAEDIYSDYNGIVDEVMVDEGTMISAGTPICTVRITQNRDDLTGLLYVPVDKGKRIEAGMTIQLAPNGVDVSQSGSLIGVVRTVSQYPMTAQGIQQHLGNAQLAQFILQAQQGAVMEVTFDLVKDADSDSGYLWTSKVGEHKPITPGSFCTGSIIIERKPPIEKVFHKLSQWLRSR